MSSLSIWYALFVPFWLFCFGYSIHFMLKTIGDYSPSQFSFYITDIWAGIIGLLPSYLLVQYVYYHPERFRHSNYVDIGILAASQCFGMVLGRLFSIRRSGERIPRRLDQAAWILTGALFFGPLVLAATVVMFFAFALFISTILWCPALGLPMLAMLLLLTGAWRRMKP